MSAPDFWDIDPLPIPPPVAQDSVEWWRWASARKLEASRQRPTCASCYARDGVILPGTVAVTDPWGFTHEHLCQVCADQRQDEEAQ